jgi:hypothetical protein
VGTRPGTRIAARVANTMTINPVAAGLLATQLVGEPITTNLVLGLVAVFADLIATSESKKRNRPKGSGHEVVSVRRIENVAGILRLRAHAAAIASISIRKSGP